MKRFALALTLFFTLTATLIAQADLQPLAIIKLNKSETITLKQLKTRVEMYQIQSNNQAFTPEQKKEILDAMIDEKLVVQAAVKAGLNITDSQVNQYFLQSLSQQFGRQVTEAGVADILKKQTGKSLDEFMKLQVGMTTSEYKSFLKNQLIAQQYVLQQKESEIKKVAASDEEIRKFYELNKSSFVQNDMLKLFLVVFPKGTAAADAKTNAEKMLGEVKGKKLTYDQIKINASKDKTYQGGDLLIQKTALHAQQLGIKYDDLIELFSRDVGYISGINETANDYQFYSVRGKYPAKMLALSDVVQPETTITVYDYIKGNLTQQKQSQALLKAVQDITKSLDKPENVDRKKQGDELLKLLNW